MRTRPTSLTATAAATLLGALAWLSPAAHADADRAAPAGVAGARSAGVGAPLASPVAALRAERLFDPPPRPWMAGHRGIDLRAEVGDPVLSPASGVVTFVGRVVDREVLTIDHGGLRSSFEPVVATVVRGEAVVSGDVVAHVAAGAGHCAPRTCLHWGVRRGDDYVDPLDLLAGFGPVVLLPLRGAAGAGSVEGAGTDERLAQLLDRGGVDLGDA